ILAADMVGYSRLMEADEEGTVARQKAHRAELIDPKVADRRGRIVKTTGDGLLVEFASAVDAVRCAVDIQRTMAEREGAVPEGQRIRYRVGINVGDIIIDGDDILGDGVNIAARLEEIAEPGGLCISDMVHQWIEGKVDPQFEDAGEHQVKNIARPIHVWRWVGEGAPATPREPDLSKPLPLPDKPSVAVLPFENMSGDPEQEYFADGVAEDIITSISKLSQLLVIARNSSFTYKGRAVTVQDIAEELGVRYVVEGSVRKAGNRVRITAQLIDCTTGGHLWAERFDRELTDIFAVQDEVTQEIVSAMALKLTADEQRSLIHQGTKNLEAYDYFLRGREQHWLLSKESNARAKAMLKRAIDLDPGCAPAHAFLAEAYLLSYINRWEGSADRSLEQAHEHAQRAVNLDETYPQAHSALGHTKLWMRQHDRAIAEYKRATALDPSFAGGYIGLSRVLLYAGRSEEAIQWINRAMRLDPHFSDIYLHNLAQAYFQLDRYEEAIDLLKRRLIRKPDTDISRVLLAASYGHLGCIEESRAMWAEALRVNPDYSLEYRREILPYKDPCDFDHLVEGLRKA
ncbi:MAG: adenylate/guanylate cyclase domain-containing protein, partial [Woeseiaceae bacterium]